MFAAGSAAIDWCETNYAHSSLIAEYFNTISNVPIIVLPLFGLRLNRGYLESVNSGVVYVLYLMLMVGLSSTYFHACLSLFGQLLDELALLWVSVASWCVWMPSMHTTPAVLKQHCREFRAGAIAFTIVGSCLAFLRPSINAYLLMILCVPSVIMMCLEVRRTNYPSVAGLASVTVSLWLLAVTIWLSDRWMCGIWLGLGFPYLHAVWHVLSGVAAYVALIIFSYLDAKARVPERKPQIKSFHLGPLPLPYVSISDGSRASGPEEAECEGLGRNY